MQEYKIAVDEPSESIEHFWEYLTPTMHYLELNVLAAAIN